MSHITRHQVFYNLRWLPNAITLSRAIVAVIAFVMALQNNWVTSFWLLLIALSTDFLDGLAAKKLDAQTKFGEEFDALTDSLVVILGMVSLSITGHLAWAVTVVVLGAGAAIGSDRIFKQPLWRWRAALAVACLFLAWIGIVWFYAYLAYGWSWLYVLITVLILSGCALLKRHRLRVWLTAK